MYFVLASLAGTFLGVLLVESSNLLIPITAHAVYDILMLIRLRNMKIDVSSTEPNSTK
jgi:membrane protease YdiL (CAAX protease family)